MRELFVKPVGLIVILALVLLSLTTTAPIWAETELAVNEEVGFLDEVPYKIKVPENWNGTLLMYAHGYQRSDPPTLVPFEIDELFGYDVLEENLLVQGYALAASSYRESEWDVVEGTGGWAVKEGIEDTKNLTKFFSKRVGKPNRIILWGSSMGSAVTLKSIEEYARIYDGAIVLSHLGAGTTLNFDAALSIALAYDVVLGWPELWGNVGNVRDDLNFESEVVPDICSKLYSFDPTTGMPTGLNIANYGKFEFLRLVNQLPIYGFYDGTVPMDFWLLGDMVFATSGRAELEARAGGPVAQNLNHVYGLTDDDKDYLTSLGLTRDTINNWLATMNARTNIEADQSARNYLKKYADFTGDLERPVLTIVPKGDGMTLPANSSVYKETVERVNKSHFLVQKYTNGSQHVGFTPEQVMAAFEAMEHWLDTGERPDSEYFFPEDLGFDNNYTPPTWPQSTDR